MYHSHATLRYPHRQCNRGVTMNIYPPKVIPYYYVSRVFMYDEVNGGLIRKDNPNGRRPTAGVRGYIQRRLSIEYSHRKFFEHRMVYLYHNPNMDQSLSIDHINGIKDDHRIGNLRLVTYQENNFNNHVAKGYYWEIYTNGWRAALKLNKKTIQLGRYETILDARAAYLRAKKKYHVIEER